ncbi:interferon-induced protein 44-like [Electrophorus electricus]|uniref:interferon-induced protein 44-like n=1 Tax=Electrophorus electricus TaxID=8005 RepID=UPI0015D0960D|nr:interferon-induced protein 44-like [Electrophorus electricus]
MSQLDRRSEAQLLNLFPKPVKLGLLYKGRFHGYEYNTLLNKLGGEGKCVIIIYLASGPVRGVYLSEALSALTSDNDAFLFDVSENGATKYPVLEPSKASVVSYEANLWQFGDSIKMIRYDLRHVSFCARDCVYTSTGWPTKNSQPCEVELHRVHDLGHLLPNDWRHLSWTASARDDLMRGVVSFQALDKDLPRIRVLLLGPAGAGKSSFVVSARSIMYNRVVHLPIIGKAAGGFTKRVSQECENVKYSKSKCKYLSFKYIRTQI